MATDGPVQQPRIVRNDPAAMPSGLVTFLFTDVEGSTKLWEKHPRAMREALRRHDAIMREAIGRNGGIVFKTIGDAFCAAFQHAPNALLAAVDAQRDLSNEPWGETGPLRARMALHSGRTDERDGDYFGPPVNRVARLLATGHGGQILVSDDTRHLLHPDPPGDADLRDMGEHRLKDLASPERIYLAYAPGLPEENRPLRGQPSPYPGLVLASLIALVVVVLFRLWTRGTDESVASALSPRGLYQGYGGLIVELSAQNEWWLLAIGVVLLAIATVVTVLRRREARRIEQLLASPRSDFERWFVNQRTIAFTGVAALIFLGAWGYQQYLWRVALPIPDDAVGFALTREAAAATFREELTEALVDEGLGRRVVIHELPVKFDANDVAKARQIGGRIEAEAVIVYEVDEKSDGTREYVARVVFTDPSVGMSIDNAPASANAQDVAGASAAPAPAVPGAPQDKPSIDIPVLRTEALQGLIIAAAGIIDYEHDRVREAITAFEQVMPSDPQDPLTGTVGFYLGASYRLDGQMARAADVLERAIAHYETRRASGGTLSLQEEWILAESYLERGRIAALQEQWDDAVAWYQRALEFRDDLLARKEGLHRPSDARATFASLYALMADAYRYQSKSEEERFWRQRAIEEVQALVDEADPEDAVPLAQSGFALYFAGDCVGAVRHLDQAIALDPNLTEAPLLAGTVRLVQGRPDLAETYWRSLLAIDPGNVIALSQLANQATIIGLGESNAARPGYLDTTYLEAAERYYRQILAVDPTNIEAHRSIAALAVLRAGAMGLDMNAIYQGDDIALAKSQALWPLDRQAVRDLYTVAIDEYRAVLVELLPDDVDAKADLVEAYLNRAGVWGYALTTSGDLMTRAMESADAASAAASATPVPGGAAPAPVALDPLVTRAGEELLADVAHIRGITDEILSDPAATRLAHLRAWAARLQALEWEWTWYFYFFYANDAERATVLKDELDRAAEDAVVFAEREAPGSADESVSIAMIYREAALAKSLNRPDDPAVAELLAKAESAQASSNEAYAASSTQFATSCLEERERFAGDEALAAHDLTGARGRYEAALEINPQHAPALIGLADALHRLGDVAGAIEAARRATEANPADPAAWTMLGYLQTLVGDPNAATTYQQFLSVVNAHGPQRRMASMRAELERLRETIDTDPAARPAVLTLLPVFANYLDGMADDGKETFQYPALYALLGEIALSADDPAAAEPLLAKAIVLDPHQPIARTDLALSIAAHGGDAGEATDAAAEETLDPLWNDTVGFTGESLVTLMTERADAYAARFPERQAIVDRFKQRLAEVQSSGQIAAAGVDGQRYSSPSYGYELSWDSAWTVRTATADGGFEWLGIDNDLLSVDVVGSNQLGEPGECLQLARGVYESGETTSEFNVASGPDGQPYVASGEGWAETAYTFAASGTARVVFMHCRVLPGGGATVLIAAELPPDEYEADRDAIDAVLAQLIGPDGVPLEVKLPELMLPEPAPAASPVASPAAAAPEPGYAAA